MKIFDKYDDDALTPYKRKKAKKTPKKSKHKHVFKRFVGIYTNEFNKISFVIAEKCEICDKTKIVTYFPSYKTERFCYKMISSIEEVKEHYPDLEIKEIENPLK